MLAPWKKSCDPTRQHIKKQRHYSAKNVCVLKGKVFPVVMCGCQNGTIKKAEHQRTDAFELWCWRRLLRVSWPARESNQSILKKIKLEYSLEGLMLKVHSFGHLMWSADSLEKTLMLRKVEGMKRRGWQRIRWLDGITTSMVMNLSKALGNGEGQGSLACCNPGRHKESDMTECLNSRLGVTWRNFLNRPLISSHLSICIFIQLISVRFREMEKNLQNIFIISRLMCICLCFKTFKVY